MPKIDIKYKILIHRETKKFFLSILHFIYLCGGSNQVKIICFIIVEANMLYYPSCLIFFIY